MNDILWVFNRRSSEPSFVSRRKAVSQCLSPSSCTLDSKGDQLPVWQQSKKWGGHHLSMVFYHNVKPHHFFFYNRLPRRLLFVYLPHFTSKVLVVQNLGKSQEWGKLCHIWDTLSEIKFWYHAQISKWILQSLQPSLTNYGFEIKTRRKMTTDTTTAILSWTTITSKGQFPHIK